MTSPPKDVAAAGARFFTNVLRVAGVVLVILVLLPLYRRLDLTESDLVLRSVIISADLARTMLVFGTLIVMLIALILARLLDAEQIEEWCRVAGRRLAAIPSSAFVW